MKSGNALDEGECKWW